MSQVETRVSAGQAALEYWAILFIVLGSIAGEAIYGRLSTLKWDRRNRRLGILVNSEDNLSGTL
jgi:hypothetical protein